MVSEKRFLDKTRQIIDSINKLKKLRSKGKIDKETYQKDKKEIDERISSLKEKNLELLDEKIRDLDERLEEVSSEREDNLVDQNSYKTLVSQINRKKDDFDSERNFIQLSDNIEYIKHLKQNIESGGFLDSDIEELDGEDADGDVPGWAFYLGVLMVFLSLIGGFLSGRPLLILTSPVSTLLGLLLLTGVMHFVTSAVGIEFGTFNQAYTCVMMIILLNFLASIAVSLGMLVLFFTASFMGLVAGIEIHSVMESILYLRYIVPLIVSVYSVMRVYETGAGKAFAAVVIQGAIWMLVSFITASWIGVSI